MRVIYERRNGDNTLFTVMIELRHFSWQLDDLWHVLMSVVWVSTIIKINPTVFSFIYYIDHLSDNIFVIMKIIIVLYILFII